MMMASFYEFPPHYKCAFYQFIFNRVKQERVWKPQSWEFCCYFHLNSHVWIRSSREFWLDQGALSWRNMLVVGHSGSSLDLVSKDFTGKVWCFMNEIKRFNCFFNFLIVSLRIHAKRHYKVQKVTKSGLHFWGQTLGPTRGLAWIFGGRTFGPEFTGWLTLNRKRLYHGMKPIQWSKATSRENIEAHSMWAAVSL